MTTRARMVEGDGDPRHGTANGYQNHRCRCDACRAAHAEYTTRVLKRNRYAQTIAPDDPRHGTENLYNNYGCRCDACKAAGAAAALPRSRRWNGDPENRRRRDAQRKALRMTRAGQLPDGDRRHGTQTGYREWMCRCDACRGWARATKAAERARTSR